MVKRASIRWNRARDTGCLRIGDGQFDHRLHLPWHASATIFTEDDTAEVVGYASKQPMTPSDRRAMGECLARDGFAWAVFEHFDADGNQKWSKRVDLSRFRYAGP